MAENDTGTFWDHLSILRTSIIRSIGVVLAFSIIAFCLKETLFEGIIFAPTRDDFATFGLFRTIGQWMGLGDGAISIEPIRIINTQISAQMFIHMDMAFWMGLMISIPYISIELWRFVSPALYAHEKSFAWKGLLFAGILFYLGVLTSYFLIFPLSVNFLSGYHVSGSIDNLIDLDSYTGMLVALCLGLGVVFELPVLAFLLAKIGILSHSFLKSHRKHSFVVVLILAAIITPTTDAFTMLVTAMPLYLVYELSVWVVKRAEASKISDAASTDIE